MKSLNFTLISALSFLLINPMIASADTWDLTQTWNDGGTPSISVTAHFSGDYSSADNTVTNIANATLSINGSTPISVFAESFNAYDVIATGAIVSYNQMLNNFVFADTDIANGDNNYTSYYSSRVAADFAMDPTSTFTKDSFIYNTNIGTADEIAYSGSWSSGIQTNTSIVGPVPVSYSLTDLTTSSVPEPETYTMFAVGLLGLGLARKKSVQA